MIGSCVSCHRDRRLVGRGLCDSCYRKHRGAATLAQFPQVRRSLDEFAAEYESLTGYGWSRRDVACALGVTPGSMVEMMSRWRRRENSQRPYKRKRSAP